MTTQDINLKSSIITSLDAQPVVMPQAGEYGSGKLMHRSDIVAVTAAGIGNVNSYYRLCRVPTNAKIKGIFLDASAIDTNTTTVVAFAVHMGFSDSAYDGTPVALQGTVPTTACNGATVTPSAAGSMAAANALFGTATGSNANATYNFLRKDLLFNGTLGGNATTGAPAWIYQGPEYPLYKVFGFQNGQGQDADPGGFMDVILQVTAGAVTGAAGNVRVEVHYAVP